MTTLQENCTSTVSKMFALFATKSITIEDMPPLVVKPTIDWDPRTMTFLDRVTKALVTVVWEAGPTYLYRVHPPLSGEPYSGYYVHDGKPDCLIGRVLHLLGADLNMLSQYEGAGVDLILPRMFPNEDVVLVHRAASGLRAAQQVNDMRMPWGQALIQYRNTINN